MIDKRLLKILIVSIVLLIILLVSKYFEMKLQNKELTEDNYRLIIENKILNDYADECFERTKGI